MAASYTGPEAATYTPSRLPARRRARSGDAAGHRPELELALRAMQLARARALARGELALSGRGRPSGEALARERRRLDDSVHGREPRAVAEDPGQHGPAFGRALR